MVDGARVARGLFTLNGNRVVERDSWVDYRDVIEYYREHGRHADKWGDWDWMTRVASGMRGRRGYDWGRLVRNSAGYMGDYHANPNVIIGEARETVNREFIVLCCALEENGCSAHSPLTTLVFNLYPVFGFSVYTLIKRYRDDPTVLENMDGKFKKYMQNTLTMLFKLYHPVMRYGELLPDGAARTVKTTVVDGHVTRADGRDLLTPEALPEPSADNDSNADTADSATIVSTVNNAGTAPTVNTGDIADTVNNANNDSNVGTVNNAGTVDTVDGAVSWLHGSALYSASCNAINITMVGRVRDDPSHAVLMSNNYVLDDAFLDWILRVSIDDVKALSGAMKKVKYAKTGARRDAIEELVNTVVNDGSPRRITRLTSILNELDGTVNSVNGAVVDAEWFNDTMSIPTTALIENMRGGDYSADDSTLPVFNDMLLAAAYRVYDYHAQHHAEIDGESPEADEYYAEHPSLEDEVSAVLSNPEAFSDTIKNTPVYTDYNRNYYLRPYSKLDVKACAQPFTGRNAYWYETELKNELENLDENGTQLVYNAMMNMRHISLAYPVWFLSYVFQHTMPTLDTGKRQASKNMMERASKVTEWIASLDDDTFGRLMRIRVLPLGGQNMTRPFPDYDRFHLYGSILAPPAPPAYSTIHAERTRYCSTSYLINRALESNPFHRDLTGMLDELEPIMQAMTAADDDNTAGTADTVDNEHTANNVSTADNANTDSIVDGEHNDNNAGIADSEHNVSTVNSANSEDNEGNAGLVILGRLAAWYDAARVITPYWGECPFLNAAITGVREGSGGEYYYGLLHTMYTVNSDGEVSQPFPLEKMDGHSITAVRKYSSYEYPVQNLRVNREEKAWLLRGVPPMSITLSSVHVWKNCYAERDWDVKHHYTVDLFPNTWDISKEYYSSMNTTREQYEEWLESSRVRERYYEALGAPVPAPTPNRRDDDSLERLKERFEKVKRRGKRA